MEPSLSVPRLRLLGQFRLEYQGAAVDVCVNGQRLLAFLALRRRASRTVLAGALWPEVTEGRAHGSLRTTLWRLPCGKQEIIECGRDTLSIADAVRVDVHALADTALGVVLAPKAFGDSAALLGLLGGGDLLPGWDEEWVLAERERLRQLRLHALDTLAEQLARQGRPALGLEAALTSVRIEPLRESAHRAVVSAHLAEGNVAEAVRHYHAFRRLLREELGVEPSHRFATMLPPVCHDEA
ncbi:BTAD domain-containing putative transcriptional regulator [Streptomyces pathocidini]|uniref:AfsR/SARP family transcriptional regulator n=1 Tax=Streptomyces pathocidini TaxID=1650571 RepID=UPI0033E53E85